jgi:hypothetical protein
LGQDLIRKVGNHPAQLAIPQRTLFQASNQDGFPFAADAGITLDDLKPYLRDEVSNVWRLWKAGVVRENYARADVGGVVIVFECADVDEAKRYIEDFPLTKAGLIEWQFIALGSPLPLEFLFDPTVDVGEPFDRTTRGASSIVPRRA